MFTTLIQINNITAICAEWLKRSSDEKRLISYSTVINFNRIDEIYRYTLTEKI